MSEKPVSWFEGSLSQAEGGNKIQKLVLGNAKKDIMTDSWPGDFISSWYLFSPQSTKEVITYRWPFPEQLHYWNVDSKNFFLYCTSPIQSVAKKMRK